MNPNGSHGQGGLVSHVAPDSIAARVGLRPGDRLVAINGHCLRDLIDFRFYGADETLRLEIVRCGLQQEMTVERAYGQEIGLEFTETLFDGMRRCNNRCPFCFVHQMPPRSLRALRSTLYLHDDDYRYSFLLGNYCTLTNLEEADWTRIAEQRLSPLYVSIHASDLMTRRRLLGNPSAPDILDQLRRLGAAHVQVHGQIVIVPGINDGDSLRRSISDLLDLWPTVETLALVPVGLTRFHRGPARPLDGEQAAKILALAREFEPGIRARTGGTWLYPSDELYLLAGSPIPAADHYDNDAQYENGVGLVRELVDDWTVVLSQPPPEVGWLQEISLACGTLIAPTLRQLGARLAERVGISLRILPIVNRFFGETVTVSGLLTGEDLVAQLKGQALGEHLFLPRAMFGASGRVTLDDMTLDAVETQLNTRVSLATGLSDIVDHIETTADSRFKD
jgi:putative radical SAM enzyme (TIGR03279 family)